MVQGLYLHWWYSEDDTGCNEREQVPGICGLVDFGCQETYPDISTATYPTNLVHHGGITVWNCIQVSTATACFSPAASTGHPKWLRNISSSKWFKKVDTNHFKFRGSTDEECCHPKYCSELLRRMMPFNPGMSWKQQLLSSLGFNASLAVPVLGKPW